MGTAQETGARGENAAADYLLAGGFELLHRNWRSGRYEIDIIAFKNGCLHMVEVKSRSATGLTKPEEALTDAKFRSMVKAAELFLQSAGMSSEISFDLIAVDFYPDGSFELRHYPEAVHPRW